MPSPFSFHPPNEDATHVEEEGAVNAHHPEVEEIEREEQYSILRVEDQPGTPEELVAQEPADRIVSARRGEFPERYPRTGARHDAGAQTGAEDLAPITRSANPPASRHGIVSRRGIR